MDINLLSPFLANEYPVDMAFVLSSIKFTTLLFLLIVFTRLYSLVLWALSDMSPENLLNLRRFGPNVEMYLALFLKWGYIFRLVVLFGGLLYIGYFFHFPLFIFFGKYKYYISTDISKHKTEDFRRTADGVNEFNHPRTERPEFHFINLFIEEEIEETEFFPYQQEYLEWGWDDDFEWEEDDDDEFEDDDTFPEEMFSQQMEAYFNAPGFEEIFNQIANVRSYLLAGNQIPRRHFKKFNNNIEMDLRDPLDAWDLSDYIDYRSYIPWVRNFRLPGFYEAQFESPNSNKKAFNFTNAGRSKKFKQAIIRVFFQEYQRKQRSLKKVKIQRFLKRRKWTRMLYKSCVSQRKKKRHLLKLKRHTRNKRFLKPPRIRRNYIYKRRRSYSFRKKQLKLGFLYRTNHLTKRNWFFIRKRQRNKIQRLKFFAISNDSQETRPGFLRDFNYLLHPGGPNINNDLDIDKRDVESEIFAYIRPIKENRVKTPTIYTVLLQWWLIKAKKLLMKLEKGESRKPIIHNHEELYPSLVKNLRRDLSHLNKNNSTLNFYNSIIFKSESLYVKRYQNILLKYSPLGSQAYMSSHFPSVDYFKIPFGYLPEVEEKKFKEIRFPIKLTPEDEIFLLLEYNTFVPRRQDRKMHIDYYRTSPPAVDISRSAYKSTADTNEDSIYVTTKYPRPFQLAFSHSLKNPPKPLYLSFEYSPNFTQRKIRPPKYGEGEDGLVGAFYLNHGNDPKVLALYLNALKRRNIPYSPSYSIYHTRRIKLSDILHSASYREIFFIMFLSFIAFLFPRGFSNTDARFLEAKKLQQFNILRKSFDEPRNNYTEDFFQVEEDEMWDDADDFDDLDDVLDDDLYESSSYVRKIKGFNSYPKYNPRDFYRKTPEQIIITTYLRFKRSFVNRNNKIFSNKYILNKKKRNFLKKRLTKYFKILAKKQQKTLIKKRKIK